MANQILSDEKFQEIYTDEKFRNQVANAYGYSKSNGQLQHMQTCSYPITYIVTDKQITEAKTEKAKAKQNAKNKLKNKLVFVSMGMTYEPRYNDDVCCHRIRTEITNPDGRKFFIEVGTWGNELMRIDFVIDRDQENHYSQEQEKVHEEIKKRGGYHKVPQSDPLYNDLKKYQEQPYYWYKNEVWKDLKVKYTKQNVIDLVNNLFDCNFTEIEIDEYNLSCDDFVCVSPKKSIMYKITETEYKNTPNDYKGVYSSDEIHGTNFNGKRTLMRWIEGEGTCLLIEDNSLEIIPDN